MLSMLIRAGLVLVIVGLAVSPVAADRAEDLAKKAKKVQPERCEGVASFKDCHANYRTGCSKATNPQYDAYLNFLKNQLPKPALAGEVAGVLGEHDFEQLEAQTPDTLGRGGHADHAEELAALGEGNIYAVVGYLYYAEVSPRPSAKQGETTNCQLTGEKNSDYHLGIGFDPAVATKLRQGLVVSRKVLQQTSIIVEMTPHFRVRYQPKWTIKQVGKAVGRQVKAIGQLMIDNEHIVPSQNCGHPEADLAKCWRKSAWEIHPVTEFYVCMADTPCEADSVDWKPLAEL